MSYYEGLSFDGIKGDIENFEINVEITDNELARAIKLSDANEFYRLFNSREGSFDADQSIAGREFAEYNAATDKKRWMTEKLYYATLNPDVFMNLLCVPANAQRRIFPTKFVEDCKKILVAAVKKGVDVYANISYVIEAERDQREYCENNPSTIESAEQYEACKEAYSQIVDMEKLSPYKKIFDASAEYCDVLNKLKKAEDNGDKEQVEILVKEAEVKKQHLTQVMSKFDMNVLTRVAQNKQKLVEMTADPEKKVTLKEKRDAAIALCVYKFAKRLEEERKQRVQMQAEEDEIREYQELQELQQHNETVYNNNRR